MNVEVNERALWRKLRLRILLPLMALITFSSLDRVNISFAALQMNKALGVTPEAFGFAVGIFFLGYLLFQFPSTAIQRRLGMRRWILGTVLSWGLCATAMAFVHTAATLYVLRFLLGVAESGLTPGIVYYCSRWLPEQFRARAIAVTLLAIPLSVIVGGPVSGWLMSSSNPLDLAGWRWMFLMEGLPTIALAFISYHVLPDTPADARWLVPAEQAWLEQALLHERVDEKRAGDASIIRRVVSNPRLWAIAAVWFALLLGSNGIIFWLPQVLKQLSGASDTLIGITTAVPWIGIAVGMSVNSWHSDRTQERYWHVGIAALLGALGLTGASVLGSGYSALALLFVGGVGIGAAQGVFWTIPGTLIHRDASGGAITLVNLIGNFASLIGPYAIGVLRHATGSFVAPVYAVSIALVIGSLFLALAGRAPPSASNPTI